MNLIDILSTFQACTVAHVDTEAGILIVWNGSYTFRVFSVQEDQIEETDVFMSGDLPLSFPEARRAAKRHAAEMLELEAA